MPIHAEGEAVVAHFGTGDILVSHGRTMGKTADDQILLIPSEPRPVGSVMKQAEWDEKYAGKTTDDVSAPVRLVFDSVASLNVLVDTLIELREEMEKQ